MGKKAKEFKAGDFIFAKVKGYPAWPARVQGIKGKKYFVFFYGTREIANLAPNMIFDYAENKDKFLTKTVKRKDFNDGVKQIEHDFTNNVPLEDVFGTDSCFEKSNADITMNEGNETIEESTDPKIVDAEDTEKVTEKPSKKRVEDSDEGALVIDEGKKGRKPKTPAKAPKTPKKPLLEDEEVVSRSGRKIKPKRFIEEETEEQLIMASAPKKRRATTPDKKVVPEKRATPDKKTTPEKKTSERKSQLDKSVKRYNTIAQSEIEDLKEPFNSDNNHNILLAYLPSGKYIGVKLFQGRPTSFKSEDARLQWDKQAAKNAISLKLQLEKGEIKPDSVSTQIETALRLTEEEKANLDKDREYEATKFRVAYLKTEMKLIELDAKIKTCLSLQKADIDLCLKLLDELKELNIQRLMLLKHPTCVQTVKRMRCYVGNKPCLPNETREEFDKRAAAIRQRADDMYTFYRQLFTLPTGLSFSQHFSERVAKFKECTSKLTNIETLELVVEPLEMSKLPRVGKLDGKKRGSWKYPQKRNPNEVKFISDDESIASNKKDNTTDKDTLNKSIENMETSDVIDNENPLSNEEGTNTTINSETETNSPKKQSEITNKTSQAVEPVATEIAKVSISKFLSQPKEKSDKSKTKDSKKSDKGKETTEKDNETSEKTKDASDKTKDASDKTKDASDKTKVVSDKTKHASDKTKVTSDKTKESSDKTKVASDKSKSSNESNKVVDKTTEEIKKHTESNNDNNEKLSESNEKLTETSNNSKSEIPKDSVEARDKTIKGKESEKSTKESNKTDKHKDNVDKRKDSSEKAKDKREKSIEKTKEITEKVKEKTDKAKDLNEKNNDKLNVTEKSKESNKTKVDKSKDAKDKADKTKESVKSKEQSEKSKVQIDSSKEQTEKFKVQTEKSKEQTEKSKEHTEKSKVHTDKSKEHTEKSKQTEKYKEQTEKSKDQKEKSKEHTDKSKQTENPKEQTDKLKEHTEKSKVQIEKSKQTEKSKEQTETLKELTEKTNITVEIKDETEKSIDNDDNSNEKTKKLQEETHQIEIEIDKNSEDGEPKAKRIRETRKTELKPEPSKTPTKKKTK